MRAAPPAGFPVDGTVSVIATATNTVTGSPITVGTNPVAFGLFIGPAPAPAVPTIPAVRGWPLAALAAALALVGARKLAARQVRG